MTTTLTGQCLAPEPGSAVDQNLIYDFGMDLCQDTDFYLKKGFRVVAIDANPAACDAAARRYADEVRQGRLTIVNKAISDKPGNLVFYVCKTLSAWSTASEALRDEKAAQGAEFVAIDVPTVRSGDLFRRHGTPYFAKIDIEGFDITCLEGLSSAPVKPPYLSTEVDFYQLDHQIGCLTRLGYRRFALVGQAAAPHQRPPKPAQEGAEIDYVFAHHASGLFGRELPHAWLPLAELRLACRSVVRQYRAAGLLRRLEGFAPLRPSVTHFREQRLPLAGDWYDIHAAF